MRVLLVVPVLALVLTAASQAAGERIPFDQASISAAQCMPAGSGAKVVVDVRFKLANWADAGYADQWAVDHVNRHLTIWKHSDGTYCAQIDDAGSTFVTRAGPSPSGLTNIAGGITGTFKGGYVTMDIVGKFTPTYPTHGDLGTFDTRCDLQFDCPGKHPTWLSYFAHPVADQYAYWGWLYDGGKYGTWLDQQNVIPPYGGDIRS